jgi:hypothetical protein
VTAVDWTSICAFRWYRAMRRQCLRLSPWQAL